MILLPLAIAAAGVLAAIVCARVERWDSAVEPGRRQVDNGSADRREPCHQSDNRSGSSARSPLSARSSAGARYLQPRLDAAGARFQRARRLVVPARLSRAADPIGAGYLGSGSVTASLVLFAIGDLPVSFLFAWLTYRMRSLWAAVFLHSFHNTISQWLFPKLFVGDDDPLLLGEGGVLPMAGYWVLGTRYFRLDVAARAVLDGARAGCARSAPGHKLGCITRRCGPVSRASCTMSVPSRDEPRLVYQRPRRGVRIVPARLDHSAEHRAPRCHYNPARPSGGSWHLVILDC